MMKLTQYSCVGPAGGIYVEPTVNFAAVFSKGEIRNAFNFFGIILSILSLVNINVDKTKQ